jgi:hypothetical protein
MTIIHHATAALPTTTESAGAGQGPRVLDLAALGLACGGLGDDLLDAEAMQEKSDGFGLSKKTPGPS